MLGFIVRTTITAAALWRAVSIVPGLQARDGHTLVLAARTLGVVNAAIRHVAFLFSVPITFVTFGLLILVVNAGMLAVMVWLVPAFTVQDATAALIGGGVVSIVSATINGGMTTG